MFYQKNYFSELLQNLTNRGERAIQGLLSLSNPALRQFIHERLTSADGVANLLADPIFEPTFGWKESEKTMGALANSSLLHKDLAKTMNNPPANLAADYTFPKNRHLFTHQLEAWNVLNAPEKKSVVVTSGTGSGKTECFLVPILNQLAQEVESGENPEGVRALFVYPLNALINSQQSRLDAWTDGFNGKIRHCLYTGSLEKALPNSKQEYKGQVIDRNRLRESPPQLLVTNATMLEYMLVRQEDAPILEKSQGKLRWIILDEAHTYIGSQAAEMALLLRRVMLAFNVQPKDVRFVATSATFGSDKETIQSLRSFLADIGGISTEQVHVVQGSRLTPPIAQEIKPSNTPDTPEFIYQTEPEQESSATRYQQLEHSPTARRIRKLFTPNGHASAKSLNELIKDTGLTRDTVLNWLDLMSGTHNLEGITFLPLRAHIFHQVIPTIRACVDSNCPCKENTPLASSEWPFGMVYLEERSLCNCSMPLMPIVSCTECNESFLETKKSKEKLVDTSTRKIDEFSLDEDTEESDLENRDINLTPGLITKKGVSNSHPEQLNKKTLKLTGGDSEEKTITLNIFSGKNECPCCGITSNSEDRLFRYTRVGAPSILSGVISTALEFCPEDEAPTGKPFQGRKLISFTDSRQGTARIAAKLQQDSERNRLRGLVYQHLARSAPKTTLNDDDLSDLKELTELEASGEITAFHKRALARLRENLANASIRAELNWDELVTYLAGTSEISTLRENVYKNFDDAKSLASMLLAREFYSRPKRANSLETFGLVKITYPRLKYIQNLPAYWPNKNLDSWKAYLKMLIDFFIRQQVATNIHGEWLKLFGTKILPRWVKAPIKDNLIKEKLSSKYTHWPAVNSRNSVQSRPVSMLCKAFNWSTDKNRDQIDSILREAWDALILEAKLLTSFGDGYKIKLEDFSFSIPENVYFCEVTRRFIDTPFEGLSPYTPRAERSKVVKVIPYTLPTPEEALLHKSGEQGILAIRDWIKNNETIQELRNKGLWSDLADTILEGGHYFRAAEHSAQQPKHKLDRYENDFKAGKLNLLSCSTTMEMGVDIGGINIVAMNNVPPHPANYLQRAGRAGRRREGRAVAITVCKNTPHDQSVFNNPSWPFTTPMRMPQVSLQSHELVQRHINSWLLSYWLKQVTQNTEIKTINTGDFFLRDENNPLSLSDRFLSWCENQASEVAAVNTAINSIVKRSVLSLVPGNKLIQNAADSLKSVSANWLKEHEIIVSQFEKVGTRNKEAAYRALESKLKRFKGEYLLGELANQRFLPGYGFPTDVVSFDNICKSTLPPRTEKTSREDNRARYRDLASRDRVTGLREYAPGAELVMDGLVYRSAGITLNWHAPASAEGVKELQLFKHAWRCRQCGTSGTTHNPNKESIHCLHCGESIDDKDVQKYLVPAGFAVDFYEEPHNDISKLQYIPVEKPWLTIPSSWIYLVNAELGQFRTSPQAHLFNYTAGTNSKGFAICLECGRAEPMLYPADNAAPSNEQYLPKIFRTNAEHRRLRGGKKDDETHNSNICPGSHNSWKIQKDIHLGHDSLTDALEIVLRDPQNHEWLNERAASYSIAVALREAIAEELGIQSEELGCDSQPIKVSQKPAYAIRVFDLRSGGYTTQASTLINERSLWRKVVERLSNCECSRACQRCLMSFDTRFEVDNLDRHAALEWINKEWLDLLALPKEMAIFGPETKAEITTLQEAIEREITRDNDPKNIGLYFAGSDEEWDIAAARKLRSNILTWENSGHNVQLHLPDYVLARLSDDQKAGLLRLTSAKVKILTYTPEEIQGLNLNATVCGPSFNIAWASNNETITTPQKDWNLGKVDSLILKGPANSLVIGKPISIDQLSTYKDAANLVKVEIHNELDGPIKNFAERFCAYLSENANNVNLLNDVLRGDEQITSLDYTDRYVRTPFSVNMLINFIYALASKNAENFDINIIGQQYQLKKDSSPYRIWDSWATSEERDAAIVKALEYCGLENNANVFSANKLPHYRQLCITLKSGKKLIIQLDQGLSYWLVDNKEREKNASAFEFDFKNKNANIGEKIIDGILCNVIAPSDGPTQLFISVSE